MLELIAMNEYNDIFRSFAEAKKFLVHRFPLESPRKFNLVIQRWAAARAPWIIQDLQVMAEIF